MINFLLVKLAGFVLTRGVSRKAETKQKDPTHHVIGDKLDYIKKSA